MSHKELLEVNQILYGIYLQQLIKEYERYSKQREWLQYLIDTDSPDL